MGLQQEDDLPVRFTLNFDEDKKGVHSSGRRCPKPSITPVSNKIHSSEQPPVGRELIGNAENSRKNEDLTSLERAI